MRKLYLWVLAILAPVAVYCAVFFANDPYNYFGFAGKKADTSDLIGKMLDFCNHEYDIIVIGDSRLAYYDMSEWSERSGLRYANMAYGGAIPQEMVHLLRWCLENRTCPIQEIVLDTGFYHMNELLQRDRVASVERIIQNPAMYAFSIENAQAMFTSLLHSQEENDTENGKEITPEQKWSNFETYREKLCDDLEAYRYADDVLDDLAELCDLCAEQGIKVTIVLPPWWEGYYDLLEQYQLMPILDEYKEKLSQHARLMDYEYKDCAYNSHYEDFSDYCHFHNALFDEFLEDIYNRQPTNGRVWENGKCLVF